MWTGGALPGGKEQQGGNGALAAAAELGGPSGTAGLCTAGGHGKTSGDLTHPLFLFAQGDMWGAFSLVMERVQTLRMRSRMREKCRGSEKQVQAGASASLSRFTAIFSFHVSGAHVFLP